jgi:hypothetical protein
MNTNKCLSLRQIADFAQDAKSATRLLPMPVILSEVKDLLVQGIGSPHDGGPENPGSLFRRSERK